MTETNLQQTDDVPEAVSYVKHVVKRRRIEKKNANVDATTDKRVPEPQPTVLPEEAAKAPEKIVVTDPAKQEAKSKETTDKPDRTPSQKKTPKGEAKAKPSAPQIDRSTLPRRQLSAHRVAADIEKRLHREYSYRLENDQKTSLANIADEVLNIGLEHFEKRRQELDTK